MARQNHHLCKEISGGDEKNRDGKNMFSEKEQRGLVELKPSTERILLKGDFFHSQDVTVENSFEHDLESREAIDHWREVGCGAACVEMILHGITGKHINFGKIIKTGTEVRAYKPGIGWVHEGLVKIFKKYGLDALRGNVKALEDLGRLMENQFALILSVTPGLEGGKTVIEGDTSHIKAKGGHLVIAYGYKTDKDANVEALLVNDPDYWLPFQKKGLWVDKVPVKNSWTGNIVAIKIAGYEKKMMNYCTKRECLSL